MRSEDHLNYLLFLLETMFDNIDEIRTGSNTSETIAIFETTLLLMCILIKNDNIDSSNCNDNFSNNII